MSNANQSPEIQSIDDHNPIAVSPQRRLTTWVMSGMTGVLLVGCGIEPEILTQIEQASFQQKEITASFDDQSDTLSPTSQDNSQFTPAFPDRKDPFHINQNDIAETIQQTESSDIRVVGFANMGSQQAILKIAGETKFVSVGDRVNDIEVIDISPPRVRLKNGNFTWNASMFTHQD